MQRLAWQQRHICVWMGEREASVKHTVKVVPLSMYCFALCSITIIYGRIYSFIYFSNDILMVKHCSDVKSLWESGVFPKPNQNPIYNFVLNVKNVTAALLPLGRSPLSQASSFLLSSTCSSAACSLCGRMESSSSSWAEGARPTRKNNQNTVLPFKLTNLLQPWSWICCMQLLPVAGNGCCPGRQPAPVETRSRVEVLSLYDLLELFEDW